MALALLTEIMLASGKKFSLDTRNLRDLCVKMCVLSFKYVDRRSLWDRLFPDDFADWPLIAKHHNLNALGDLHVWIPLLELCAWDGVERHEPSHAPIQNMRRAMRAAGIDVGGSTLLCQLMVLNMLQGVPSLQAFQMMTCRSLSRDTTAVCAQLLAALSDSPQTPEACEESLAAVLGDCMRVNTAPLESQKKAAEFRRESLSASLRQKTITACSGRPRLRDRATPSAEQKVRLDTAHGTWESYTGFCQLHQFPNVLSENVKARLYFLASQQTWEWRPHVSTVLRHDGEVCSKLQKFPVSRPDLGVLHQVMTPVRFMVDPHRCSYIMTYALSSMASRSYSAWSIPLMFMPYSTLPGSLVGPITSVSYSTLLGSSGAAPGSISYSTPLGSSVTCSACVPYWILFPCVSNAIGPGSYANLQRGLGAVPGSSLAS